MRRDNPEVAPLYETRTALPAPAATVVERMGPFVTEERRARIEAVLAGRTRRVVPVLDHLDDPHNSAAVLRSSDAFGLQEVHLIATDEQFVTSSRVAKGTERWLDVVRHVETASCTEALRARGYKVLYAAMDGTYTPSDLPSLGKVALVFGNEHRGVSDAVRALADGSYRIPMRGFVESLNVSVAAAITLHSAVGDAPGDLDAEDLMRLRARFFMQSVDRSDEMLRALLSRHK